jgi:hypothetical protein
LPYHLSIPSYFFSSISHLFSPSFTFTCARSTKKLVDLL